MADNNVPAGLEAPSEDWASVLTAEEASPTWATEQQPQPQPSLLDRARSVGSDIIQGLRESPRAVLHGAGEAANQTLKAIDSAGDWMNQNVVDLGTPHLFDQQGRFSPGLSKSLPSEQRGGPPQIPNVEAPKSTTGGIIAGASQFIAGMIGAGKITKLGGWAGAYVNGALSDAVAFDPHQQRVSNLIEAQPSLQNPITDFLKSKPGEGEAEGRLKNALEGAGLGALTEATFLGIKALWARRQGNVKEAEALEQQMEVAAEPKPAEAPAAQARAEQRAVDVIMPGEKTQAIDREAKLDSPPPGIREEPQSTSGVVTAPELSPFDAPKPKERKALSSNYSGPLSSHAPTMFRETNAEGAEKLLPTSMSSGGVTGGRTFLADHPSMALGQGDNRGVMLAFDAGGLNGKVNTSKPGWENAYLKGMAEYTVDDFGGDSLSSLRNSLTAVRVNNPSPEMASTPYWRRFETSLRSLEKQGWVKTEGNNFSEWRKPVQASSETPGASPAHDAMTVKPRTYEPAPGNPTPQEIGRVTQADPVEGGQVADGSRPLIKADVDQRATITQAVATDTEALLRHGSVEKAQEAGHVFAPEDNLFSFNSITSVDDFNRVISDATAEAVQKQANRLRGGNAEGIQTWEHVQGQAYRLATEFGADPQTFIGTLHLDAQNAPLSSAKVVAYAQGVKGLGAKVMELGKAYAEGKPGSYGTMEELGQALDHHLALYADVTASFEAVRGNVGRALNSMKLANKADGINYFADKDALVRAILANDGDLGGLAKVAQRHFATTPMERIASFYTANLLWSPWTHFRNIVGNALMVPTQAANKIIGGAVTANRDLALEGTAQLVYSLSVIGDGFKAATKAWRMGRPVLDPGNVRFEHNVEISDRLFNVEEGWKNVQQIGYTLANKAWRLQQTPFRALGAADEFFKQLVAGSAIKAEAFRAAIEKNGMGTIFQDPDGLQAFISRAYAEAYDPVSGALVNTKALDEARIATFTSEYEKGSWQEGLAKFVAQNPILRIVGLPFLKTPMNLWKQSFRWTPGMNVLVDDVRRKWAMGGEDRAKIIGEMGVGLLLWGGSYCLAASGKITGGGPMDPKKKSALQATGWRPYSYVTDNPDGTKTYTPMGNYDPFGLILGMVADLHEAGLDIIEGRYPDLDDATTAVFMSIVRNAQNRNYFDGLGKLTDALSESGGPDKIKKFLSDTAMGFVPGSTGLRAMNDDPFLRDARTVVDKMKAQMPMLSHDNIPLRYNAWGEPVERQHPLYSVQKGDTLTGEIQRAIEQTGHMMEPPSPRLKAKQSDASIDLRTLSLKDGTNAYDKFMEYMRNPTGREGQSLREVLEKEIAKPYFQRLTNEGAEVRGSKLSAIKAIRRKYIEAAKKNLYGKHPEVLQALEDAKAKRRDYVNNAAKYRQEFDEISEEDN